jgi:hypothetical protein
LSHLSSPDPRAEAQRTISQECDDRTTQSAPTPATPQPALAAALLIAACATPGSEPKVITVPAAARTPECLQPGLDTQASVVRVATDVGAHGSGVVIGHNRVLTAAHVVVDAGATRIALTDKIYEPRARARAGHPHGPRPARR